MRRVGFQMQVRKDKVEEYKEAHRNVWPECLPYSPNTVGTAIRFL